MTQRASEPSRRRVIWTIDARDDLASIRAYIGQFKPLAAQAFALRLVRAAENLADTPARGNPMRHGQRALNSIWPYVIRYRIEQDTVFILRIRHGARRRQ